jgi:hypothetical protein
MGARTRSANLPELPAYRLIRHDGVYGAHGWDRTRLAIGGQAACFVCEEATSPVDMTVECDRAVIFTLPGACFLMRGRGAQTQ